MSTLLQPYLNSKKSTCPYLYLEARSKKAGKFYVRPDVFSNARYTNVPLIYDRRFGTLGYPIIKKSN
jgi:hypothetical protein